MKERTRGAIALMPAGNLEGSWWYLVLKTMEPIKRNNAVELPMPDVVIDYLNTKVEDERGKKKKKILWNDSFTIGLWRSSGVYEIDDEQIVINDEDQIIDDNTPTYFDPVAEEIDNEVVQIPADSVIDTAIEVANEPIDQYPDQVEEDEDVGVVPEDIADDIDEEHSITFETNDENYLNDSDEIELDHRGDADTQLEDNNEQLQENNELLQENNEQNIEQLEEPMEQTRYNLRKNRAQPGRWRGVTTLKRSILDIGCRRKFNSDRRSFLKKQFGLNMTIKQGIKILGYEAVKSVVKEMMQMVDRKTFQPINIDELSEQQLKMIITSKTFLKDKYTAQGVFDKIKARLVAGGHLQDRNIYDNGASPTVSTSAVFIIAGIAAMERRAVATVDFPGAFLYSEMPEDGPPIFMRLNKFETMVLVHIDETYKKYVQKNGTCIVQLKRALYGCVESARLWYELI
jgi:hypothetical protein